MGVMLLRKSLYDYCVENGRTELLEQWDAKANLPMTPESSPTAVSSKPGGAAKKDTDGRRR